MTIDFKKVINPTAREKKSVLTHTHTPHYSIREKVMAH